MNDGSSSENIRGGDSTGGGLGDGEDQGEGVGVGGSGSTRLGRGARCRNSLSFIPDPFHSLEVRYLRTWIALGIPEI